MKTEWLRKTIADFDPYFVAPIAEKHVINANENYLNVLTIPGVKEELIQALDTFRPQIYPKPMSDDIREALADYIGGKADTVAAGVKRAEELIDSGAAGAKLEEIVRLSREG